MTHSILIVQGLYLLARVVHGKCKDEVTIFESQECNPVAGAGSIPQDQVLTQFISLRYSSSSSSSSSSFFTNCSFTPLYFHCEYCPFSHGFYSLHFQ